MTTLTASHLLLLAREVQDCIDKGTMRHTTPVTISLEVCNENDEATFENRVFGGSVVLCVVGNSFDGGQQPYIQLIGEPNFPIYSETKP